MRAVEELEFTHALLCVSFSFCLSVVLWTERGLSRTRQVLFPARLQPQFFTSCFYRLFHIYSASYTFYLAGWLNQGFKTKGDV